MSGSPVFIPSLKMTAAKAIETSVNSTNSLSRDYTNLDDQLPQTCHDSPRFKPFTLSSGYLKYEELNGNVLPTFNKSRPTSLYFCKYTFNGSTY